MKPLGSGVPLPQLAEERKARWGPPPVWFQAYHPALDIRVKASVEAVAHDWGKSGRVAGRPALRCYNSKVQLISRQHHALGQSGIKLKNIFSRFQA